jgi:hypothetical protein
VNTLAGALERLAAAGRAAPGGLLAVRLEPEKELAPLFAEAQRLEEFAGQLKGRPSRSHLEEARRAWQQSGKRLAGFTSRQVRLLCWVLEIALDPTFARELTYRPDLEDLLRNSLLLQGLVESYHASWRTMPDPATLESVLRRGIQGYTGRNKRLLAYKAVAGELFSERAAALIARLIVGQGQTIPVGLEEWRIESASGLGQAVVDAVVDEWIRRFEQEKDELRGAVAYSRFLQVTEGLLSAELVSPASIARAASALILWEQAETNPAVHDGLKAYLLEHPQFRDPRLPRRGICWDLCSEEARRRFTGWLAKKDLLFFFETVIQNDPHGRKDFWLQYIDGAEDANVALSDGDRARVVSQAKERLEYSNAVAGGGTSAFIMRFRGHGRDLVCVEFSQVGNALYVFDAEGFKLAAGGLRRHEFHISEDLKNWRKLEKFNHTTNWQWKVRSFLARNGVRPR